ncbi:MAG TPA: ABC transporter permease [Methylomirabilota bacterium]|jgi:NitT/TauT family transport system permease protein/taurine transport system permease protein|nr:ABC transporter permease [Methylomirabilota bacterium]
MTRTEAALAWGMLLTGFLAAWSLVAAAVPAPAYVLPPPTAVFDAAGELIAKGILPFYIAESLRRILTAAVVALVLGVPVGLALGMSRRVAEFAYPVLNFFQSVSGIAWLPLMLVWFGFGERTILVAVNYTVLFPVIFNVLLGVRSVPRMYGDALRTLGASRWRILRDVLVPGALPNIATGLRLGLAYGWRALIAAEMLVGAHGLGSMIFTAQAFHLTARIMLGMAAIGVLWVLFDYFILRPFEEATFARWGLVHR